MQLDSIHIEPETREALHTHLFVPVENIMAFPPSPGLSEAATIRFLADVNIIMTRRVLKADFEMAISELEELTQKYPFLASQDHVECRIQEVRAIEKHARLSELRLLKTGTESAGD